MQNNFIIQDEYQLTEDQVLFYQKNGHIFLPGLATSGEVDFYRKEINSAVEKLNQEIRPLQERDTYGKAFLQIMNLWLKSEEVKKFVLAKRFGKVAAQLMGVKQARIYHDQALFKEAGGGHTPWHQDQFYWPLDTDNTITMWMPLINLTEEMGIMQFVSSSHKKGYILSKEISDESEDFFRNYIKENKFEVIARNTMNAGDATFHSGWTLHNAPSNRSEKMREVMTIIYFPDKTKILTPDHTYRQNDMEAWLGGKMPGEYADSAMNPMV